MVFETKTWKKLSYPIKRGSYETGIIGEFQLKENKRVIDSMKFKNNHEFNIVLSILKKYGYNNEKNNNEVNEEINFLNKQRDKEEKENNWLDKKEGDMEW